jgi:hypothetical protein
MSQPTQGAGPFGARELIAFAFVEEAFAKTGDLVAGLMPLFTPVLAKKANRRFDPSEFAEDVQRTYDIPMSPLVAAGLVEKLAEAGLLKVNEGESHTYRIVAKPAGIDSFDEHGAEALLGEFAAFANVSLDRIGLRQESDALDAAFLQRLTTARFLSFTDRREKNYYRGKTISLRKVEDDEQDAVQLEQALDVLSAEFALRKLEAGGATADLLTRLMTGALIAEVVLTLQTPSSSDVLSKVTVVFDGPLILDFLDLSTPEFRDFASDLFKLVEKAGMRKVVFKHTIEEMKGTLRGPLEALQRGDQPFGPLGNRIRVDSSHAAYARATLAELDQRVEALGFEIVDADVLSTAERMKFCDAATEESLRNNIGPLMENLERRIRDAHSIATVLRVRGEAQRANSIVDARWLLVTRNDAVAERSHWFLLMRKVISRDEVPPALTESRLAGYLWFAVGGNLGALSRKKLVANCSNVMSPRTDVVSKVRQYLTDLDPEKANLFMVLMRDQRAQRCLVHSTLGFPSAITLNNAEQLLEEVRLSVAAEVRGEAEKREAELKRDQEETLTRIAREHQDEMIARESALLALKGNLAEQKTAAEKASQRLHDIQAAVDLDIDTRVQRAAASANVVASFLKGVLIVIYLILVGCAYWFVPGERIYVLSATLVVALVGFWMIPQVAYEKLAKPLWMRRLRSRCQELGVLNELGRYDVDAAKLRLTKK